MSDDDATPAKPPVLDFGFLSLPPEVQEAASRAPARPLCGAGRGRRSLTRCEKAIGHDGDHAGRSEAGRLFTWAEPAGSTCVVPGCVTPQHARGWCLNHYRRWRQNGDPVGGRPPCAPRDGTVLNFIIAHVATPHGPDDPCVIWPFGVHTNGYGKVTGTYSRNAHRELLIRRDGPPPSDGRRYESRHGPCHNPLCIIHVSWGTSADNHADRLRDGTGNRGEDNAGAKLTERAVLDIRRRAAEGESRAALAAEYGVSTSTVGDVIRRTKWTHV